jgi:hypothetical protein
MATIILIVLIAIIVFAVYKNTQRARKVRTPKSQPGLVSSTIPFMPSTVDLLMADVPANTPYEIEYDQMKF